jgi:hypothetical protein
MCAFEVSERMLCDLGGSRRVDELDRSGSHSNENGDGVTYLVIDQGLSIG